MKSLAAGEPRRLRSLCNQPVEVDGNLQAFEEARAPSIHTSSLILWQGQGQHVKHNDP